MTELTTIGTTNYFDYIADRERMARERLQTHRARVEYFEELDALSETPLKPIAEVTLMDISENTRKLAMSYVAIVNQYDSPTGYFNSGYTPEEQERRRTLAHNKLIAALQSDGINVSDRASTTELAKKIWTWLRED